MSFCAIRDVAWCLLWLSFLVVEPPNRAACWRVGSSSWLSEDDSDLPVERSLSVLVDYVSVNSISASSASFFSNICSRSRNLVVSASLTAPITLNFWTIDFLRPSSTLYGEAFAFFSTTSLKAATLMVTLVPCFATPAGTFGVSVDNRAFDFSAPLSRWARFPSRSTKVFIDPFLFTPFRRDKLAAWVERPLAVGTIVLLRFAMLRLLWLWLTLSESCAAFKRSKLSTGSPRRLILLAALFFSNEICWSREIPIL